MNVEHLSSDESAEVPKRQLVAGLIVRDGKLLMVHNIKNGLRIEPPGGKVEEGESPEAAVVRECRQELGIDVQPTSLLGIYQTQSPEGNFDVHMFLCSLEQGEPQQGMEPDKIGHFAWFTPDELQALSIVSEERDSHLLVPNVRAALQDIVPFLRKDESV